MTQLGSTHLTDTFTPVEAGPDPVYFGGCSYARQILDVSHCNEETHVGTNNDPLRRRNFSENNEFDDKAGYGGYLDVDLNIVLQILATDLTSFQQVIEIENTNCRIKEEELEMIKVNAVDPGQQSTWKHMNHASITVHVM